MSMNVALKRGKEINLTPFQTPTKVSRMIMKSGDKTEAYKSWLLSERQGKFEEYTIEHFEEIDKLLKDGYVWTVI